VAISLAVAAAVAVCTLLATGGAAAASHGSPRAGYQGMHQVVVRPGQTLWSIASAAEPTADPQTVIQQIMTANSLPGAVIHAGQVLWVPKG
jgi:Tfp pilus assembly protein FimV